MGAHRGQIDGTKKHEVDLPGYDRIGFASGIYYGSFAKPLLSFAQINLPDKKQVFFIFTCGSMAPADPQKPFVVIPRAFCK